MLLLVLVLLASCATQTPKVMTEVRYVEVFVEDKALTHELEQMIEKQKNEIADLKTLLQVANNVFDDSINFGNEDIYYKVVAGDCLWNIAKNQYGNPYKWMIIYKANSAIIDDPDLIFPYQILDIPTLTEYIK